MTRQNGTRLIKWLGDPPVVGEDGWSVPNWRYENLHVIAQPGHASRGISKADLPGLSKSYWWDKKLPHYLLEVEANDAQLILTACPNEFRDVTDNPFPEHVRHTPIIMIRQPDGKPKLLRDPADIMAWQARRRLLRGK